MDSRLVRSNEIPKHIIGILRSVSRYCHDKPLSGLPTVEYQVALSAAYRQLGEGGEPLYDWDRTACMMACWAARWACEVGRSEPLLTGGTDMDPFLFGLWVEMAKLRLFDDWSYVAGAENERREWIQTWGHEGQYRLSLMTNKHSDGIKIGTAYYFLTMGMVHYVQGEP